MMKEKMVALKDEFVATVTGAAEEVFAGIMSAIGTASLEELAGGGDTGPARKKRSAAPSRARAASSGRLARRSPEEIEKVVSAVVALLRRKKDGLRAENIREALDMDVREVPRVLKAAIESKRIKILSGQKRSTTYGVGGSKSTKAKPARKSKPAKRSKPKAKKPAAKKARTPKKAAPVETKAAA